MEKIINIKNFLNSTDAVSIEDGERLYDEIKNYISNNVVIILDFEGIESCVTRFLNPAIGQLCKTFDKVELNKNVKFKNVKPSFVDKIKAVIANAQNFYNNPELYKRTVEEVVDNA